MGRYIIRRLLQFIPTAILTLFLLHFLTSLAIQFSGNPVYAIFGDKSPPQSQIDQITRTLHLDDPCLKQKFNPCVGLFFERLGVAPHSDGEYSGFIQADFGTDLQSRDVSTLVGQALPYTAQLALIAFAVEVFLGLGAGVLAGLRSGGILDHSVKITTVLFISVPIFVLGVLVQQGLGVWMGNWMRGQEWIPDVISVGAFAPAWRDEYPISSMLLPGIVLGGLSIATTSRLTRASLLENLRADYVRTARAKGLTKSRVIGVHTLRNSLIPVATNLGLSLAGYMAGAVVTEGIFNIHGVGGLILGSIRQGEPMVVVGVTTMLVLVVLVANLLVDVLYAVLDPRIRYE